MQAFNKIAYKSISTGVACSLSKMQQAAKIALMRIKYFISTEIGKLKEKILAQCALFSKKMIGFSLMTL